MITISWPQPGQDIVGTNGWVRFEQKGRPDGTISTPSPPAPVSRHHTESTSLTTRPRPRPPLHCGTGGF